MSLERPVDYPDLGSRNSFEPGVLYQDTPVCGMKRGKDKGGFLGVSEARSLATVVQGRSVEAKMKTDSCKQSSRAPRSAWSKARPRGGEPYRTDGTGEGGIVGGSGIYGGSAATRVL